MSDITMCEGGSCPDKTWCYRHTATPNPWRQSYFTEPPFKEGEFCVYFGPNEAASKVQRGRMHKPEE